MLAVGTLLELFMRQRNAAEKQRKAAEALHELGYDVFYECQEGPPLFRWNQNSVVETSPFPQWAIRSLGPDFFHQVVAVESPGGFYPETFFPFGMKPRTQTELWRALGDLPQLKNLEIERQMIESASVRQLPAAERLTALRLGTCLFDDGTDAELFARLSHLETLWLSHIEVSQLALTQLAAHGRWNTLQWDQSDTKSPSDLDRLPPIASLRVLHALDPGLDDEDLRAIGRCTGLRDIALDVTQFRGPGSITSEGTRHLAQLQQLERLELHSLLLTHDALLPLLELPNLRQLSISRSPVTAKDLVRSKSRLQLKYLHLVSTDANDEFLAQVHEFENLVQLNLDRSKVTAAGLIAAKWPESLRLLTLADTDVTIEVLRSLQSQTQLRELHLGTIDFSGDVRSAQISAAYDELKAAIPNCQIDGDWPEEPE
jgi:hypothetical protein